VLNKKCQAQFVDGAFYDKDNCIFNKCNPELVEYVASIEDALKQVGMTMPTTLLTAETSPSNTDIHVSSQSQESAATVSYLSLITLVAMVCIYI